jgi:hypothetical protein
VLRVSSKLARVSSSSCAITGCLLMYHPKLNEVVVLDTPPLNAVMATMGMWPTGPGCAISVCVETTTGRPGSSPVFSSFPA